MTTMPDPATLPELKKVDPYEDWVAEQGVPVHRGFYLKDLRTVEVGPWARKGVNGALVILEGTGGMNDTHLVEIPGGKATNPERHLYEENVFVLSGRGATSVWYQEGKKQTFEWGPGSLFAVPLNAFAQHFNGSGTEPARFMSVTTLPPVMRLFRNHEFIFNCDFHFTDRFADESDYFSREGKLYQKRTLETNFVSDVMTLPLYSWKERGAGGVNTMLELANNTTGNHISEFPVGTYKKAHRHGPGAHVIILNGIGFSILWREDDKDYVKCDWQAGSVVVPPDQWFHEHFNSGTEPARYLALRFNSRRYAAVNNAGDGDLADVSVKEGGWQIEYEDEDPKVHAMFEEEVRKNGGECLMKEFVPSCTGKARAGAAV